MEAYCIFHYPLSKGERTSSRERHPTLKLPRAFPRESRKEDRTQRGTRSAVAVFCSSICLGQDIHGINRTTAKGTGRRPPTAKTRNITPCVKRGWRSAVRQRGLSPLLFLQRIQIRGMKMLKLVLFLVPSWMSFCFSWLSFLFRSLQTTTRGRRPVADP